MVVKKYPEARLTMAGDGPLRNMCIRHAEIAGLTDKVEFPGVLSHAEVADYMWRARAFVQHSITTPSGDSEGTPVAIMEAGASGLPVVATNHAGIPEVVLHEETGFLVAEKDARAMASAMIGLLQYPELADRLGKAARARIEANFSLEKRIERLWGIIQSKLK
jgi:glycosyltransferase involved in cell wall biosynthesis